MDTKHKNNLWWVLVFIILYIPFPLLINLLDFSLFKTICIAVLLFATSLILIGVIKHVTNKIKKVIFKVLWLLLGFVVYVAYFIIAINLVVPEVELMPVGDNKAHVETNEKMVVDELHWHTAN